MKAGCQGDCAIREIPAILLSRDGEFVDALIGGNQLAESLKKVL